MLLKHCRLAMARYYKDSSLQKKQQRFDFPCRHEHGSKYMRMLLVTGMLKLPRDMLRPAKVVAMESGYHESSALVVQRINYHMVEENNGPFENAIPEVTRDAPSILITGR